MTSFLKKKKGECEIKWGRFEKNDNKKNCQKWVRKSVTNLKELNKQRPNQLFLRGKT